MGLSMTSKDADRIVEKIVSDLLLRSGKHAPIAEDSRLDLAGMTSQDGVEAACELEAKLGIDVDERTNPLVHENGARMRTLAELQAWVRQRVAVAEGAP